MPGRIKSKGRKAEEEPATSSFSLASTKHKLDPALTSLFASSNGPVRVPKRKSVNQAPEEHVQDDADAIPAHESLLEAEDGSQDEDDIESDDEELSEASEEFSDPSDVEEDQSDKEDSEDEPQEEAQTAITAPEKRKRKRNDADDNLEGAYFEKLAREEARDEKVSKRQKQRKDVVSTKEESNADADSDMAEDEQREEDASDNSIPVHETLAPGKTDVEVEKASRTVFLANVSTEAITSKSAKKTLLNHLSSFIPHLNSVDSEHLEKQSKKQPVVHKVESIRFRSTAFATTIPKKAAFAKREIMDETSKSTNAYAVYSTKLAARAAATRLNGTVVLGRHLRVDLVAHPAKIDHRRCVFVGNLGFIDDETNMRAVQKAQGDNAVRKPHNGDVEEGLWVQFSKAGKVESVRVVRDSKTRVGKGIAYVQFADQNGVEAALLFNEKKYPPLLPRKLRVSRAKKNTGPKPATSLANGSVNGSAKNGMKRQSGKPDPERQSLQGRASKLLGRAGAAGVKHSSRKDTKPIKTPESFVFEGHRASSSQGNAGLRLGKGSGKKKDGRPRSRSAKRGAEWKKRKASK